MKIKKRWIFSGIGVLVIIIGGMVIFWIFGGITGLKAYFSIKDSPPLSLLPQLVKNEHLPPRDARKLDGVSKLLEYTVQARITPDMSPLEKCGRIANFIATRVTYDKEKNKKGGKWVKEQGFWWQNVEQTISWGKGVCADYAEAFFELAEYNGVKVNIVCFKSDGLNFNHAWNQIFLEDENGKEIWLNLDMTWDDELREMGSTQSYYLKTNSDPLYSNDHHMILGNSRFFFKKLAGKIDAYRED
jgi:hypothetical protein